MNASWITLIRECQVTLIPSAEKVTIPCGTNVQITQSLGNTVTIAVEGHLARVEGKDLDALGFEPRIAAKRETKIASGPVDEDKVWEQLRTCFDPEIPVNVVDLGLIYKCCITEGDGKNLVTIDMTLTAPGCSMGPILANDVEEKVYGVENVTDVLVNIVFDPPWDQTMIAESAKLQLGIL